MRRLEGPFHQSVINDYLACPQALLLRIEGVEPLFRPLGQCRGSAVHAAIAVLHAQRAWDRWPQVFEEAWCAEFSRPGPPINAPPDKIEQEYADWRQAVGRYVALERDAPVLFSELRVRGAVASRSGRLYALEGTVDQVRPGAEGGYDLYEIKTNATLPGRASLERNVQLCLYCWCCVTGEVLLGDAWVPARQALPGFLRRCVCYRLANLVPYKRSGRRPDGTTYRPGDLRGDPRVSLPVKADQLVEGAQAIARIIAAIRAGGFFWNPSSRYGGCDACPYKYACGTTFTSNSAAGRIVPPQTLVRTA